MYRLVNIPHASNTNVKLKAHVKEQSVYIEVVDNTSRASYNICGVCDMFIGDHMFEEDKRDSLRMMVGEAIIRAIEAARDVGYRQAQADIRSALGVKEQR